MKTISAIAIAALALTCLVATAHAAEARFFDDCAGSTMRIQNKLRFVGGDVFKLKKLAAGSGTLACNKMCQDDVDCWSWNYEKGRKLCYLMSSADGEMSTQRAGSWTSGFRECTPQEADWDNGAVDTLKANSTISAGRKML